MNTKNFGQNILKAFIIAFLVLFPHFVPLYAVVGVQLEDFFAYGILHQKPNLITAQLTVAFSHSELIVGDFWLIMGINCIRLLV